MKLKGFDKLEARLKKDRSKNVTQTLNKAGKQLFREVKKNTPVDTGRLRRSWKLEKKDDNTIIVYNNTEYALHVEYGHRTRGKNSTRVVPGRFMLRDSVKKFNTNSSKILKDVWK